MIRAVVIDVDDTLCMTEAVCFEIENEALVRMGRPAMSREIHLETWGHPLAEAIKDRSPGVDVEQFIRAITPVIQEYDAAGKFLDIPEANYQAMDDLIAAGKQIMLLSSRTRSEMAGLLSPDHPIASRISAAYYHENTKVLKPDPHVFDPLLREYGYQPAEVVYIGDSVTDGHAANGADIHFIVSLESALRSRDAFEAAGVFVTAYIDALSHMVPIIKKLDKQY